MLAIASLELAGCYASHVRSEDAASDATRADDAPLGHDASCRDFMTPSCCDYGMTECMGDATCTDPERAHCVPFFARSVCAADERCARLCASPDTPIATADGERPIAELRVGDRVWSLERGTLRLVPISRVVRNRVRVHAVVRVRLETMRTLEISPGHPTADGRRFADLVPGTTLDGVRIVSVETVPYAFDATYDVLPDSETGTYVAGGVLVGSTLFRLAEDQNAVVSGASAGVSRSSVAGGRPASAR